MNEKRPETFAEAQERAANLCIEMSYAASKLEPRADPRVSLMAAAGILMGSMGKFGHAVVGGDELLSLMDQAEKLATSLMLACKATFPGAPT